MSDHDTWCELGNYPRTHVVCGCWSRRAVNSLKTGPTKTYVLGPEVRTFEQWEKFERENTPPPTMTYEEYLQKKKRRQVYGAQLSGGADYALEA